MHPYRSLPAALFPILLTAATTAQDLPVEPIAGGGPATAATPTDSTPAALPTGESISVMRESYGVRRLDDAIHAEGADYWAIFDRGGIRYTPALGRAAAEDMPLRLTLVSIRRGGSTIHRVDPAAAEGAAANPRARIDEVGRAVYDRGSITERFEARRDGIEQSFRFPERPAGQGDLVVRLRVETALPTAAPSEGQTLESLRFVAPNIGGVSVGAVTGISADGYQARGSMRYDGQHLELVLPDAFVSRATYPMVLDPLIGTDRRVGGSTNQDISPDVAYDATSDRYLVVWQRVFSSSNVVVRGRMVDGTTGDLLPPSFIEITPQNGEKESKPAVANLNRNNGFVVVWHQTPSSPVSRDGGIYGCFVTSGAIPRTASAIATERLFFTGAPDVGGDSTTRGDDVAVVYSPPSGGIRYVRVDYSQSDRIGRPNIEHTITTVSTNTNPAISKSGGPDRVHCIVWEAPLGIGNRFVNTDGVLLSLPAELRRDFGVGRDLRQPEAPDVDVDVPSAGRTTARIVYHEFQAGSTRRQVRTARLVVPPAPTDVPIVLNSSHVTVSGRAAFTELTPTTAFLGRRPRAVQLRAIGWAASTPGSPAGLRVQKVDASSNHCGTPSEVTRSGTINFAPKIAAQFSGGSSGDGALMVWQAFRSITNDVRAQLYASAADGGRVRDAAPGCTGGGQLSIVGPFAHGQQVDVTLTGASTSANLCLFAIGVRGARTRLPCGPCSFLLAPSQNFVAIQNGRANVRGLEIPCDPQFNGVEVDFQFWVGPLTNSGCSLIPVATSNVVRATIDN